MPSGTAEGADAPCRMDAIPCNDLSAAASPGILLQTGSVHAHDPPGSRELTQIDYILERPVDAVCVGLRDQPRLLRNFGAQNIISEGR